MKSRNNAFERPMMPSARTRVCRDGHCAPPARLGALRLAAQREF